MKACDVQIGGEYTATINKEKVPVRITAEKSGGGWSAINTATNKKVFISLAKFLEPLPVAAQTQVKEEGPPRCHSKRRQWAIILNLFYCIDNTSKVSHVLNSLLAG